jgi:hypothetical protein
MQSIRAPMARVQPFKSVIICQGGPPITGLMRAAFLLRGLPGTPEHHARLHRPQARRARHAETRRDPEKGKRYKTVELIIAEEDWLPPQTVPQKPPQKPEHPTTPIVPVRIHYTERDLQRQVKAIGGRWDASRKLWMAPEEYVKRIGLSKRIVR